MRKYTTLLLMAVVFSALNLHCGVKGYPEPPLPEETEASLQKEAKTATPPDVVKSPDDPQGSLKSENQIYKNKSKKTKSAKPADKTETKKSE